MHGGLFIPGLLVGFCITAVFEASMKYFGGDAPICNVGLGQGMTNGVLCSQKLAENTCLKTKKGQEACIHSVAQSVARWAQRDSSCDTLFLWIGGERVVQKHRQHRSGSLRFSRSLSPSLCQLRNRAHCCSTPDRCRCESRFEALQPRGIEGFEDVKLQAVLLLPLFASIRMRASASSV